MMKVVAHRRLMALSAIAALIAGAVVVGGWRPTSSRSTLDRAHNEGGATHGGRKTIALNGVDLTVPAGWDSESFVNPSGMSVFRLGSFPLQHAPDDDVGQVAQASMGPHDVLINIIDVTATDPGDGNSYYESATPPLTVDGSRALQQRVTPARPRSSEESA